MRFVALVLGLLFSTVVLADTKTVTWNNAAKNTDDTNIPTSGPGSLVRTTIEYGTCVGNPKTFGTKSGEIFVAAPAQTAQLPLVVIQEFCLVAFHSNTFATTFAACISGASGTPTCPTGNSARSNVAVTQSNPPKPLPPGNVVVGDFVAYQIVQTPDNVELLAFGHVMPGTMCNMARSVNGLYLVPWNKVTMPNGQPNTTRKTVFASCG